MDYQNGSLHLHLEGLEEHEIEIISYPRIKDVKLDKHEDRFGEEMLFFDFFSDGKLDGNF